MDVIDFGIRAMDLTYALQDGYRTAILVGAAQGGDPPGTVSLIEPDLTTRTGAPMDRPGTNPTDALRLARQNGGIPERTLLVTCESSGTPESEWDMNLSAPVRAVIAEAVRVIESVLNAEEGEFR